MNNPAAKWVLYRSEDGMHWARDSVSKPHDDVANYLLAHINGDWTLLNWQADEVIFEGGPEVMGYHGRFRKWKKEHE